MGEKIVVKKCALCGSSNIEEIEGTHWLYCKSCRTQYYVKDNETRMTLVEAQNAMNRYDFKMADDLYKALVTTASREGDDDTRAVALWGRLMASFGIVNLRQHDEIMHPLTYYNRNFERVSDVGYFEDIMNTHINEREKSGYRHIAQSLDGVYSDIRNRLANGEDYEVFICNCSGDTAVCDSIIDGIYHIDPSIHIFNGTYSELTEENDAEIFSALIKSKAIIVIADAKEHIENNWVENAWRRWLLLIENSEKSSDSLKLFMPNSHDIFALPNALNDGNILRYSDIKSLANSIYSIVRADKIADEKRAREAQLRDEELKRTRDYIDDSIGTIVAAETRKNELVVLGDYTLKLCDDGASYSIVKYSGDEEDITIPAVHGGMPIRELGESLFSGNTLVKHVDIPKSVRKISDYAFSRCLNLESVALGDGIETIGKEAFFDCGKIGNIMLPESLKSLGMSAFAGCNSIEIINIPRGVKSIPAYAFASCTMLEYVTLPEGLETIGERAFFYDNKLKNITLPDGVKSIDNSAFYCCTSLEKIDGTKDVLTIGDEAFFNCKMLKNIDVSSAKAMGKGVFNCCYSLKNVALSRELTAILDDTFKCCTSLVNIVLGKHITSIGNGAFLSCKSLTNIKLPIGLNSIGANAFDGCSAFSRIEIPASVRTIGNGAFDNCNNLETIGIPRDYSDSAKVKNIGITRNIIYITDADDEICDDEVLSAEDKLCAQLFRLIETENSYILARYVGKNKSVKVPATYKGKPIVTIAPGAFSDNKNICNVTMTSNIQAIGASAFENCPKLAKVTLPSGIKTIREMTFAYDANLETIAIPNGISVIETGAFYGCESLTNLGMSSNIEVIGRMAFAGSGLGKLSVGSHVLVMGDYAVKNCKNLTSLALPRRFNNPYDLRRIGCNSSVNILEIEDNEEETLQAIAVLSEEEKDKYFRFKLDESRDEYTIIGYIGTANRLAIPSRYKDKKVTEIAEHVFDGDENLESVVIPSNIAKIGKKAFYNCSRMTHVSMDDGTISIGDYAFSKCGALREFIMPDSVENVGCGMCADDGNMEKLHLSYALDYIGDKAFMNCNSITSVDIPANIATIGRDAFMGCDRLSNVQFNEGNTGIGCYAFAGTALGEVNLPDSVNYIGYGAFSYINSLKKVTLPYALKGVNTASEMGLTKDTKLTYRK